MERNKENCLDVKFKESEKKSIPRPPMGILIGNKSLNIISDPPRDLYNVQGYIGAQCNGQRTFTKENWKGPEPSIDCEIFIAKVPNYAYENEIIPLLLQAGTLYQLRLLMKLNGRNRGFAFARFSTPVEAQKAVQMFNNYEIRFNIFLGVVPAKDNTSICVRKLPLKKFPGDIITEICRSSPDVIQVSVARSGNAVDRIAIVKYSCHRAAALARKLLVSLGIRLWRRALKTHWIEAANVHLNALNGVYDTGVWTKSSGLQMWVENVPEVTNNYQYPLF